MNFNSRIWQLFVAKITYLSILSSMCASSAEELVMRKTVNLKLASWKGAQAECVNGVWLTSHGDPVTNVTSLRYISRNGTLYFPPFDGSRIDSKIHKTTYKCIVSANGEANRKTGYHLAVSPVLHRFQRSLNDGEIVVLQERFPPRVLSPGVGASVQLECGATGASKIYWNRDGRPLPPHLQSQQASRVVLHGILRSTLNITHLTAEEAGLYSCTAMSQDNSSSAHHSARLDVYGSPYIRNMLPLKILSGSKATIYCPYYGYPISKVQWDRSERSSSIFDRRFKRHINAIQKRSFPQDDEGWLVLDNVGSSDNGVFYTCTVSSPTGEMAKRTIEIIVTQPPVLDELSFGTNVKEGEIAKVVCSLKSGDTPVFFSWLKDGASIPAILKIEERNLDLFSILIIRNVGLQHCGIYTCIVANQAGRANQTAELFIKVAPKWIEEPQNTSVVVGREGNVGCSASGYPQPQVHWMKKDENLGIWRPVLELRGNGLLSLPNGSLIFETVSLNHEGMYSCNVDNGVPQPLNKAIWISVKRPVSFEGSSINMTTRAGHPTTLSCEAFGDNPIRIGWLLNGVVIESLPMRLTSSSHQTTRGAISEIIIGSTVIENSGLYQCKASNPHGTAVFSINLIVKEPPGLPAEVAIEAVWGRTARIGWRTPSGPQPVGYTLQYTPHGHTLFWDTAPTINVSSISGQQRLQTELNKLQPATSYATRLCSVGELDSSPFTRPILFTTLEEAPEEAPSGLSVESTLTPGELSLTWLPPPAHSVNGILLGYIIKAVPQIDEHSEKNTHIKEIRAGRKVPMQAILSELLKSTRYAITVSCYNSAGQGPPSNVIYQQTRGGVPEVAPSSIECTSASSTSIRITWSPLPKHLQGGAMLGYNLIYTSPDGIQKNHSTIHNEIFLKNLSKFTNYTIEVAGFCQQGIGPISSPLICSTSEDIPSAPSNVKGLAVSSDAIVISWKPPLHPNGRLTHYTVYYKSSAKGESSKSYRVAIGSNSKGTSAIGVGTETMVQLLRQLQSGQRYEAWVTASSGAGEGEHSRRVHTEPSITVMAGVASLGGEIWIGAGQPLQLGCYAVGNPQPTTNWYHNNHIISHHPRFILKKDHSLLVHSVDTTLEGNYTCHAQNLFGSDKVEYYVIVLPIPTPPTLHVTPTSDSLLLEWDPPRLELLQPPPRTNYTTKILGYFISWREATGEWYPEKELGLNTYSYTVRGLRCGNLYDARLTIRSTAGNSKPSIVRARTNGEVLTPPVTNEWIWSNATHMWLQIDSWEKGECGSVRWSVDYRPIPSKAWLLPNSVQKVEPKNQLLLGEFHPGSWYQLRITATNTVGATTTIVAISTKTLSGEEIGPYSEALDTSILVIVCSSILLFLCMLICIFAAIQKHRHRLLCGSVAGSVYKDRSNNTPACPPPPPPTSTVPTCPRLYTSPTPLRKPSKTNSEMFEISPYAQFSMGFQTFGHVENQDRPGYIKNKQGIFSTETSFQMGSESEDSDSLSKSATIKSAPRKTCRVQYHR